MTQFISKFCIWSRHLVNAFSFGRKNYPGSSPAEVRARSALGAVLIVFLITAAISAAGQNTVQLRVDVELVTLDVYVDDLSGKPMTDLGREDFRILEDGAEREIKIFDSAETPYNVLLLFDRSSSTEEQWPFLVRAISRFIGQLPDQHRVALAAFDDKPEMLLNWRPASDFGRQAFTIRSTNGGTRVYEALDWSTKQLRNVKGRKGIIVFTDGVDNRLSKDLVSFDKEGNPSIAAPESDTDFQKLEHTVREAGVPIYFVAVNTDQNPDPRTPPNKFDVQQRAAARERMERLSERSNGRVHLPRQIQDVGPLYQEIGWQLGHSYTLGFSPGTTSHDGSYHHIEVQVRERSMRVTQARDGYYAR